MYLSDHNPPSVYTTINRMRLPYPHWSPQASTSVVWRFAHRPHIWWGGIKNADKVFGIATFDIDATQGCVQCLLHFTAMPIGWKIYATASVEVHHDFINSS